MKTLEENDHDVRKIIFVGLDNAGKTSIILALLREMSKLAVISPTRHAKRRTLEFLGMKISEWDLGGHERYRRQYLENAEFYFRGTDILIYVIDIQDYDRIVESYTYLNQILKKLNELKLNPAIYIFFHKNDPNITDSIQIKINNTISYIKEKIEANQNSNKFKLYKTTIFDLSSITNAISKIFLNLFSRVEVIKRAIQEFVLKSGIEGIELLDDNSLIIGSYYQNNNIKRILNSLSPYFLRLNDGFENLKALNDDSEIHMVVEKFGKYFIFKKFRIKKQILPYYILLCTTESFLKRSEIEALIQLLREILSHEV